MCGSMADIQSATSEIRRGKKRRKTEEETTGQKYNALFHRAIIKSQLLYEDHDINEHYRNRLRHGTRMYRGDSFDKTDNYLFQVSAAHKLSRVRQLGMESFPENVGGRAADLVPVIRCG